MRVQPKKLVYQLTKRNPTTVADESRAGGFPPLKSIPSDSFTFRTDGNGRTEKVRIRYRAGESSIFPEKQSDFAGDPVDLKFIDGILTVLDTETSLIDYLDTCAYNEDKNFAGSGVKTKFKRSDFEKDADNYLNEAKRASEAEAEYFTMAASPTKLRAVSRKLGINVNQPAWQMRMHSKVKAKPNEFLSLLANPQEMALAERTDSIFEADEKNIIRYALGKWSWTGEMDFLAVTKGFEPHAFLAEWTFTDSGGAGVWGRLKANLDKDIPTEEEIKKISETTAVESIQMDSLSESDLRKKGKNHGLIVRTGTKTNYIDLDGVTHDMGNSNDAVDKFIRLNSEIKSELKKRIAAAERE